MNHTDLRIPDSRKPVGFSLLELLVAIGITAIVSVTVLALLGRGVDLLRREEHRRVAVAIAEERLEIIRNVAYDAIGTTGGIPEGPFTAEETVERGAARYAVRTRIAYVDDPFDQLAPDDAIPNDRKQAAVDVSWGANPNQVVTLMTEVAPVGLERTTGGGTLRLRVFDARGNPVEGATIQVTNGDVQPTVALTLPTDGRGEVTLPGTPPSTAGYHVRAAKAGMSTDATIVPGPENPNPIRPPLTVLAGEVTSAAFAIDRLGAIALTFVHAQNDRPFRELTTFTIQGSKVVGNRPNPTPPPDALPVYKAAPQSFTTDRGTIEIGGIEWDTYRFSETMAGYDLAWTDPLLPIELLPGATRPVTVAFAPHADHALRIVVRDAAGLPIADASIRLDTARRTFNATTPAHGHVFLTPIDAGTATLTVERSGYQSVTREVTVNGLTEEEVRLEPL